MDYLAMLFALMAVAQCLDDLNENFPNDVLGHIVILSLAFFYQSRQIPISTVLHNDK
jgi:hypothetical protein